MTLSASARSLALFGAASALALLLDQPAQAHGIAHGGIAAGFLHQISGVDHLLLLVDHQLLHQGRIGGHVP
jgi:urease accessory protein